MLENSKSKIGKVIAVMSGKGGVGKSSVTSSIAVLLAKRGYQVGILDADLTGPSIPQMFGMGDEMATGDENGIYPVESKLGIKVMSVNLLLPNKEEPVIWRGPIIASVIKQFFNDVCWGELDYLLIDMPPGTGDVPLTVYQTKEAEGSAKSVVDGVVTVTSPQDLVSMIVKKAYNMAVKMEIPIVGFVENFSYMECPDCGRKIEVFGKSKVKEEVESLELRLLSQLPIVPDFAQTADEGTFDEFENEHLKDTVDAVIDL